jgi:hypothetical protein
VQKRTDGHPFGIVKSGVRPTGMPVWGATHTDDELWQLIAFARHLPKSTDDEKAKRQPDEEEEEHHHQ